MSASCVSLKFAVTQLPVSATIGHERLAGLHELADLDELLRDRAVAGAKIDVYESWSAALSRVACAAATRASAMRSPACAPLTPALAAAACCSSARTCAAAASYAACAASTCCARHDLLRDEFFRAREIGCRLD